MKLAFLWHMHQPFYKNLVTNRYEMPWVRLHGIKDYYDMMAILKDFPKIKQTFNVVPSLLEQLEEYGRGEAIDDHLELSRKPADTLDDSDKTQMLVELFKAHYDTMIAPYARYKQLHDLRLKGKDAFNQSDWLDLQVWSNLAWVDPMFFEQKPIAMLRKKGQNFTEDDKLALLEFQKKVISQIIPLYKEMAQSGQVELSVTPYFHPILPLLCDTDAAKISRPQILLPKRRFAHPEDASTQVKLAIDYFESRFGYKPNGMWPSEGSVSEQIIPILADFGIKWIATDEEILALSLGRGLRGAGDNSLINSGDLYRPYKFSVQDRSIYMLFRDHALSDLIGFVYSRMEAQSAANDFVMRLEAIDRNLQTRGKPNAVVSIILDGENAWEYFPNDGRDFLKALYGRLSESSQIQTVTFSEAITDNPDIGTLGKLHAGSWINHDFNVWIGHPEDNKAWDLLYDARQKWQKADPKSPKYDLATKELLIAEGSDWCWWFGDDHQSPDNDRFDQLFRSHLKNTYRLLGLPVPAALSKPIRSNFIMAHLIEPIDFIKPEIDGRLTHYYEWANAGYFDCQKAGSTMHKAERILKAIYYGYGKAGEVYVRLDPMTGSDLTKLKILLELTEPTDTIIICENGKAIVEGKLESFTYNFETIAEFSFSSPKIKGENSSLKIRIYDGDTEMEKWPPVDTIPIRPDTAANKFWSA